jgi:hypothetical protein
MLTFAQSIQMRYDLRKEPRLLTLVNIAQECEYNQIQQKMLAGSAKKPELMQNALKSLFMAIAEYYVNHPLIPRMPVEIQKLQRAIIHNAKLEDAVEVQETTIRDALRVLQNPKEDLQEAFLQLRSYPPVRDAIEHAKSMIPMQITLPLNILSQEEVGQKS